MRNLIQLAESLNEADNMSDDMLQDIVQKVTAGQSMWIAKTPAAGTLHRVSKILEQESGLHVFRIMTSYLGQWSHSEGGKVDIDVTKFHAPTALIIDVDAPLNDVTAAAIVKAYDETRDSNVRLIMVAPPGSVSDHPELMQRFGHPVNL